VFAEPDGVRDIQREQIDRAIGVGFELFLSCERSRRAVVP
jgi:hypothetical protein